MTAVDSDKDRRDLSDRASGLKPDARPDAISLLRDMSGESWADESGSGAGLDPDSGGRARQLRIPERHRVELSPEAIGSRGGGSGASPGTAPDALSILRDLPGDSRDGESGSGGALDPGPGAPVRELHIPERHRVVPSSETARDLDNESLTGRHVKASISPDSAPHGQAMGAAGELPGVVDVRRFPSDQAERRAEGFLEQGNNDRGYDGTCGLASTAQMLSDLTGENYSENDVVNHAAKNELCVTDSSDPAELGGTTVEDVRTIHRDAGVQSFSQRGCDRETLARLVESGDGVIAAVKAAEYWPPDTDPSEGRVSATLAQGGTDHMVWVTGVSRSPDTSVVTGFYLNDTGRPDGAGLFVSNAEMKRAWEFRGGELLVARRGSL